MLVQCWPIVYDSGPTLYQHWVNVACLLQVCGLTVLTGWHGMLAHCCLNVGAASDEQQHVINSWNISKKENERKKWRKYEACMITGVATGISFQISHFRRPDWYPFSQVRGLTYGKKTWTFVFKFRHLFSNLFQKEIESLFSDLAPRSSCWPRRQNKCKGI